MFRLNREVKLKNGEFLTPFLVDGDIVYCMTRNKKTIARNVKEFDFTPEVRSGVLMVSPIYEEIVMQKPLQEYNPIISLPEVAPVITNETVIEEIESKPATIEVKPIIKQVIDRTLDSLVVMRGKVVHAEDIKKEVVPVMAIKNEDYI